MDPLVSEQDLRQRLSAILRIAAEKLEVKNFSVNLNLDINKGDGFLSEVFKSSILDNDKNTKIDLFIKKAPKNKNRRYATSIDVAYKNEIYFYSNVLTSFKKFQQSRGVGSVFNNVPTYLTSDDKIYEEIVVIKDITQEGFEMKDRNVVLDNEHVKSLFEIYSRFHAISLCIKDQQPDEYNNMSKAFYVNVLKEFTTKEGFGRAMTMMIKKSFESLNPDKDRYLQEKFRKYTIDTMKIFSEAIIYQGNYSCILHGDCWLNNFMFKYKDTRLVDIKLLDFQLMWTGTPVYDLSYFFYSAGSKNLFDKLDYYLDIYHKCFSKFVQEMGSKPDELLPRQVLNEDWKKYSKFGMMMALLLTHVKLMSKKDSIRASDSIGKKSDGFVTTNIDENVFNLRVKDILYHMYEIDAL